MVYPVDRLHPKWSAPDTIKHIAALSCVAFARRTRDNARLQRDCGRLYVCVSPNHTKDSTDCAAMRRRERTCAPRAGWGQKGGPTTSGV